MSGKTKGKRSAVCLALLAALTVPGAAVAGELGDWLKAAAAVFLQHEAGHYIVGSGEQLQPQMYQYQGTDGGDLFLRFDSQSQGGSASRGFVMDGGIGLGYVLSTRPAPAAPDANKYPGAFVHNKQLYLPQVSLTAWQRDYSSYQQSFAAWRADVIRSEGATAGAGFAAQQMAIENSSLPTPIYKKSLILSGLFQAGYVAYHYAHSSNTGDIKRMALAAPEPLVVGALLVSAASDAIRGSMAEPTRYRIGFLSDHRSGAVGLSFSGVF